MTTKSNCLPRYYLILLNIRLSKGIKYDIKYNMINKFERLTENVVKQLLRIRLVLKEKCEL